MTNLVVANWKLNGSLPSIDAFAQAYRAGHAQPDLDGARAVVCPPVAYTAAVAAKLPELELGAQDCSVHASGAYTGEVAADMLSEIGCDWVIVGHSERRQYHAETDTLVAAKASAAQAAGLTPIVCVGEHLDQREAGSHLEVVKQQVIGSLANVQLGDVVIAYEPIWAIGTGVSATPNQADEMHGAIRSMLVERFGQEASSIPIIYGGSVKPETAGELFACPSIDGALVGGASLEGGSFRAIVEAASSGRM